MPQSTAPRAPCDALYVAWKLDADSGGTASAHRLLRGGEERNLYRLRSWMVAKGEARALLIPAAPLEEIADALFRPFAEPFSTKWIAGQRKCAAVTREIETMPVQMGLASRPEQWPLSSAFQR